MNASLRRDENGWTKLKIGAGSLSEMTVGFDALRTMLSPEDLARAEVMRPGETFHMQLVARLEPVWEPPTMTVRKVQP